MGARVLAQEAQASLWAFLFWVLSLFLADIVRERHQGREKERERLAEREREKKERKRIEKWEIKGKL